MNKLHPGARWLFRIKGYFSFVLAGIFLGLFIIVPLERFLLSTFEISIILNLTLILLLTLGYILFAIIASEIYARMSYNRWFYEFNEEGLRLERGIIWKKYSNVPYIRVQNVDIHRGILARMLGFSSLIIQTAGYSGQTIPEGYIPALETSQAEQIRNFVMEKITKRK